MNEERLLGLCMQRPEVLDLAVQMGVTPRTFDVEEHRDIFQALLQAERDGRRDSVSDVIARMPGNRDRIEAIERSTPISLNVEAITKEVLDAHWARKTFEQLRELMALCANRKDWDKVSDIKRHLSAGFDRIMEAKDNRGPSPISAVFDGLMPEIERQIEERHEHKPVGIPTGFKMLDSVLGGGFGKGSINVVAARTGKGKTTLALNFLHTAALAGNACAYFTVEMLKAELARKLLSLSGKINGTKLRVGALGDAEVNQLWDAQRTLYPMPIWIDDTTEASFEAFEFACRRLKRMGRLDLVVIDYLQQFTLAGRYNSTHERITAVSHRLKQLALKLELTVIALAQLNREAEKGEELPDIWHIKDSGAIEQDADLIVLIHTGDSCSLFVGKNRHGRDRFGFPVESLPMISAFKDLPVHIEACR